MDVTGLINLVKNVGETRNIEFKRSMNWDSDDTRLKITKSIMAMSNIRDGGTIILGVNQIVDSSFEAVGMSAADADSFNSDHIKDHVNNYARPYSEFMVNQLSDGQKRFITIKVEQFNEIPVICGKEYYVNGKCEMQRGDIFTRTRKKPESSKVTEYLDLQEIINLAIERGVKVFVERAAKAGLSVTKSTLKSDEEMFGDQVMGLR